MARQLGFELSGKRKRVLNPKGPKPPKYASEEERRLGHAEAMRNMWKIHPHPRGMLGKRHTREVKAAIGEKSSERWALMSEVQKGAQISKSIKTRRDNADGGSIAPAYKRGSWAAGWREIGPTRKYYRSRWEANYARYLEWLRNKGDILDWKHEPETFWFEAIKRGVRSYLPDFRVWELDGTSKLHEVKGWMDARSKTTLKRMAKYHPHETIVVIREKGYNSIARQLGSIIPGWESSERKDRW